MRWPRRSNGALWRGGDGLAAGILDRQELEDGTLVRLGGRDWTATMTISLFCSLERLDDLGRLIWAEF
jgi:hypothetical protein